MTNLFAHRLPTVSASQALQELEDADFQAIPSGLPSLDLLLSDNVNLKGDSASSGGYLRRHVYEIYGPPGAGKTALALQASRNALRNDQTVVWIDTSHRLAAGRLTSVLADSSPSNSELKSNSDSRGQIENLIESFHHFVAPTLPHLLALLAYPSPSFPPLKTSLIIVDTISNVFATAFPRATENNFATPRQQKKSDAAQWAIDRRWAVMGEFTAKMNKLATVKNLSIILLNQTSTKFKTQHGVLLGPALSSRNWLDNINTRLIVFRDFVQASEERSARLKGANFVGIVKHKGVIYDSLDHVVSFKVKDSGLEQIVRPSLPTETRGTVQPTVPGKRKREEIADSESDEGGEDSEFEDLELEDEVLQLGSDSGFGYLDEEVLAQEDYSGP